ncbi:hypothetical protein Ddc_16560 [Ditylenchus destructor]|nr:hypothetical protein Ddc_16560 [Ditylenchus destructor]
MEVLKSNWDAFQVDLFKVAAQNEYQMKNMVDPTPFAEIAWHLQTKWWKIGGWLWARVGRSARMNWPKYGKEKRRGVLKRLCIRFAHLSDKEKKWQTSEADSAFEKYNKEISGYNRRHRHEKKSGNRNFEDLADIEDYVVIGDEEHEYLSSDENNNKEALVGMEVVKKRVRFQEPMDEETGFISETDNAPIQLGSTSDCAEVQNIGTQTGRLEIVPAMSIHFSEEIQAENATRPKTKVINRKNGELSIPDVNGNEIFQHEMDMPGVESRISNEDDRVLYEEDNADGQYARHIAGRHIRATKQSSYDLRNTPTYSSGCYPQVPMYYPSGYFGPSTSHSYYDQHNFETKHAYSRQPWNNNCGNAAEPSDKRLVLVDRFALVDHVNDFLDKGLLPQSEIDRKAFSTRKDDGRTYKSDRGSKNNNNSDDDCGIA